MKVLVLGPGSMGLLYGAKLSKEADLKNMRKTEADYISGAVVRAAVRQGRRAPAQEMMVNLVHAME